MTREEAIKLLEHISIAYTPTDAYGDYDDPQPYEEAFDLAIEALQIVRCGECKHKLKEPMYNTDKTWILYQIGDCPIVHKTVADDDFCSYGERREE